MWIFLFGVFVVTSPDAAAIRDSETHKIVAFGRPGTMLLCALPGAMELGRAAAFEGKACGFGGRQMDLRPGLTTYPLCDFE